MAKHHFQNMIISLFKKFQLKKKIGSCYRLSLTFILVFFCLNHPFRSSVLQTFFIFYFHAKRFARSLSRLVCPFYVDPPWNSKCRLYGWKKGWVWKSHVMQIRLMLQKIWYQTLSIHSFDQSIFFCQNCLFWFSV